MKMRGTIGAIAVSLVLAACGGDRPGNVEAGSDGLPPPASGRDNCDVPAETVLGRMNDATFAVFGEVSQPDGEPQYIPMGTAWAVRDQVMATNAHVTEGFRVFAENGVQFSGALAVQSRTGSVVQLLSAVTHPDYTGDPIGSPDVGLFLSQEILPVTLPIAPNPDVRLGDEILIVGFPGDVDTFIQIVPGVTVPQATSLTGQVTALRSHDLTQVVTADNLDVIQHQAPTTPGTSGSSMVSCDEVVAVNNAGTVQFIVTPGQDGDFSVDRAAAAANNFAVHVRHLQALLDRFDAGSAALFDVPVPATGGPPGGEPAIIGTWLGRVAPGQAEHTFAFAIDENGGITGLSEWPETGQFELVGQVNPDGAFRMQDNAPERLDFRRGIYEGQIDGSGNVTGTYVEEGQEGQRFPLQAQRTR